MSKKPSQETYEFNELNSEWYQWAKRVGHPSVQNLIGLIYVRKKNKIKQSGFVYTDGVRWI